MSRQQWRQSYRMGLAIAAIILALIWQKIQSAPATLTVEPTPRELIAIAEPIQPIEDNTLLNSHRVALGEKLFQEPKLSINGQVSCVSCHKFEAGGADNKPFSEGIDGALMVVNTPTVFNVTNNFQFNWDGRHATIEAHTNALMQNPKVMGADWDVLRVFLKNDRTYRQAFEAAYSAGITQETVIDAITTYEASLVTPDAPFDKFLRGDRAAITPAAQKGYDLFKAYGCISCHQGVNVGGNMFQAFGVVGDYFVDRGEITQADLGRYNVTNQESDRYVFRVPSLRNVAATAPYLHDGRAATLTEAIKIMVKYQLGRKIPAEHIDQMAQFLRTLTGEYRGVPVDAVAQ